MGYQKYRSHKKGEFHKKGFNSVLNASDRKIMSIMTGSWSI